MHQEKKKKERKKNSLSWSELAILLIIWKDGTTNLNIWIEMNQENLWNLLAFPVQRGFLTGTMFWSRPSRTERLSVPFRSRRVSAVLNPCTASTAEHHSSTMAWVQRKRLMKRRLMMKYGRFSRFKVIFILWANANQCFKVLNSCKVEVGLLSSVPKTGL